MNTDVSDAGFEGFLRELGARVPFLKVKSLRQASDKDGDGPDWMMEVEVVTGKWIWAIEVKERGQPREVRNGLLRLRNCLAQTRRKNTYGVLIAPFLSKESARLCVDAGMGYADLAGNARLCFDGVFIELQAADNSFQAKRQLRSALAPP